MYDSRLDSARISRGFLSIDEMLRMDGGNTILDPCSTLISKHVRLGGGNVIYPGVLVECDDQSSCEIGTDNVFYPGTVLIAVDGGALAIGNGNTFGPGSVQLKANQAAARITIGSRTRLLNGAEVMGQSSIGDGAQILGAIAAQNVELAGGSDYRTGTPETRGAVLKGFGLARGVQLAPGEVLNGAGDFKQARVESQLAYHPKAPTP